MTTLAITVETLCEGLGHWSVAVARDGVPAAAIRTEWSEIQQPLDDDDLSRLAILVLRAKYAGTPINALGDLLLNGVVV